MYNLLVSSDSQAWGGEPYIIDLSRCVREYTDTELTNRFGLLGPEQVSELRKFPCIFAYESMCNLAPKFGLIRDVTLRQDKVRIEYEIIELERFLSGEDLENLSFELDISRWEMNRTHWAVKNVELAKELKPKGIVLPHWATTTAKAVNVAEHNFDVALSFPGEARGLVENVAQELERLIGPNSYFYDSNYTSQLAQPSLDLLLQGIYGERSKLVVVFLCDGYQNKEWCGVEFRAIREIIKRRENMRVMFVRIDDTDIDGVFSTDGYIDARQYSARDIANFIQERLTILESNPTSPEG